MITIAIIKINVSNCAKTSMLLDIEFKTNNRPDVSNNTNTTPPLTIISAS